MKSIFFLICSLPCLLFSSNFYPLSKYCPENYFSGRQAFLLAASKNEKVTKLDSLPISFRGPSQEELFIDVAIFGNIYTARKILFHISGTHGVEGAAGSGIQYEFLSNAKSIQEDTAIIFIHALNPFGMAWNRRVNENNVDLNRNCTNNRVTPSLYALLDPILNPKIPKPFDLSSYKELTQSYGKLAVKKAAMEGQYEFPEGLFYGGVDLEEGPKLLMEWCMNLFSSRKGGLESVKIGIIDVHTGLGPFACDTLITMDPPTEPMMEVFGEKMEFSKQMANIGYRANGTVVLFLADLLREQFDSKEIFIIGQEFGTVELKEMLSALYFENALFHYKKRCHEPYDPNSEGGQALLRVFYPDSHEWKHRIVDSGKNLIFQSFELLNRI